MRREVFLAALLVTASGALRAQDPAPASAPVAEPALPDVPGITHLRSGQAFTRKGGKATPAIDVYRFLAGAGARVRATVTGSPTGAIHLRMYTAEGVEMRREYGATETTLDLFMPTDGIYYMSVARNEGEKGYKVKLDVQEAGLLDAVERYAVGYESLMDDGRVASTSCWIEPGKTLRVWAPGVFQVEMAYLGAGNGVDVRPGGEPPRTFATRVEGNEIVRTYQGGQAVRFVPLSSRLGAYRGYYCADAEP